MKKRVFLGIIVVFALGLAVLMRPETVVRAENARIVTVHIDGTTRTVATDARTVEGVIKGLDISLGEHDKTEPMMDEIVSGSDYTINVYRARPITVTDGANNYTVMTAERSPVAIAADAGFDVQEEDDFLYRQTEDTFEGLPGTQMVILRSKAVTFSLYGKKSQLHTRAETIQDFLNEHSIVLAEKDEVNFPLDHRITTDMTISVDSVVRNTKTVEEAADFVVEEIKDAQQPVGYREIKTKGVKGRKLVTYEIVIKNDGKPKRLVKKEVITKKPINQVVVIGAKRWSGNLEQWLSALRACESGGNYKTNTGNGFYGAYQFMGSTWSRIASMTGRNDLVNVMPHEADPADQDWMIIQNTKLSSGGLASQNPGCYASTGISAQPPQ